MGPKVLRALCLWRCSLLRNHPYHGHPTRPGQVPSASRQGEVQEPGKWVQADHAGGRTFRPFLGWAPTAIGYSAQGLCKFGFYEVFKKVYGDAMGEENAYLYMTGLYLAASASAEFFADIALSPMEACKVRIQTSPVGTFPTTLRGAFPKILAAEGINGFYKSLVPLWGRQIPYTMMKFACFEKTVVALYDYVVPKPRAECSKGEQLIVTFAAGYIAGVFCAIVSHPADPIVSYMNKAKGATVGSAAKDLGFKGMWGGLGPRIIMIGTLTALQWFIYDTVKVVFKLPRPPPPTMPESLRLKLEAQN